MDVMYMHSYMGMWLDCLCACVCLSVFLFSEAEAELDTSAYVQETSFLRAAAARSKGGKKAGGRGGRGATLGLGLGEEDDEEDGLLLHSDEDDLGSQGSGGPEGVRRSRRVTKGQRFQFWKNERPVYQQGRIIGLLTAEPTPHKPKRKRSDRGSHGAKKLKLKQIKLDGEHIRCIYLSCHIPFYE
jgi:hypothetical protein